MKKNPTALLLLASVYSFSLIGTVHAQFTGNNQTNTISGLSSNWISGVGYIVGNNSFSDLLQVVNGGVLSNGLGYIGFASGGSNNAVVVSGTGSVWRNRVSDGSAGLRVGHFGAANRLMVSNSGTVFSGAGYLGYNSSSSGNVAVIASGGVWSNGNLLVGNSGPANQLIVTNGGTAYTDTGYLGFNSSSSNNTALVVDTGTWQNNSALYVGYGGSSNVLVVSGGRVLADNAFISYSGSNNVIQVNAGSLFVTNAQRTGTLVVSRAGGAATLVLNGGSVTVDSLIASNGANAIVTLNSGTLNSGGTFLANNQVFAVGNGVDPATFRLLGGVHWFFSGVEIRNNASLAGCGLINGSVLVDPGGSVVADCGSTLSFTGSVTNNGSIIATNGTFINFYGPVVNSGQIGPSNSVHFYPAQPQTSDTNSWIAPANDRWEIGANWSAGAPSVSQPALYITNANSKTVVLDDNSVFALPLSMTISNLTISAPGGSSNALFLNNAGMAAPLHVLKNLAVNGGGSVSVSNSTVLVDASTGAVAAVDGIVVGGSTLGEQCILNGGKWTGTSGYVGFNSTSSNNVVVVTAGGVWSNSATLTVGNSGAANQLIVTNDGAVLNSGYGFLGYNASSSNNLAVVVSGGIWSVGADLLVGYGGAANRLMVTNNGSVLDTVGYVGFASSSNVAAVTSGGVWSNRGDVFVGYGGTANQLIVTNGGTVFSNRGLLNSSGNLAIVASGGVWSNFSALILGRFSSVANQLIVTNGGRVFSSGGFLGGDDSGSGFGDSNSVRVVDNGVWQNSSTLYIGFGGSGNNLVIDGGSVLASNTFIGYSDPIYFNGIAVGSFLRLDNGSLLVTNAQASGALVVGRADGPASLIVNGGSATVDLLVATNGANSVVTFNGGTLGTRASFMNNAAQLLTGDGTNAANFHLLGGVHSFANGLRIRHNAMLSGCGTVSGGVIVDLGGTVMADCGGTLTLAGTVTNNGTMFALNGTTLVATGMLVNNGLINAVHGAANFPGGIINNGIVLDANGDYDGDGLSNLAEDLAGTDPTNSASVFRITSVAQTNNDLLVSWMMGPDKTNALERSAGDPGRSYSNNFVTICTVTNTVGTITNYLDIGAVTNSTSFYYRIRLVP